jgi:F-type H+-transporting ATPase subunit delta
MRQVPARRYAEALFAAVGDLETNGRVLGELTAVAAALDAVPRARQVLAHPTLQPQVARRLLDALAGVCLPVSERFLALLVARGRLAQLAEVLGAYRDRVERARGVTQVRVQSARPLSVEEQEALRAALVQRFGAVDLTADVRPELIGGARVVVGDRVLDGTAAAQLARLRRTLLAARN